MKTVFVGLSGGVDSAVSAYLLKKEGYKVVGVFLKAWEPDFLPCTGVRDRLEAMRVAAHLEIPFKTYDLEEEYKKEVVDYFIEEYRNNRTPNPDVLCNRTIKFGAFWNRAKADGADFIATGHYAQKRAISNEQPAMRSELNAECWMLCAGADPAKDQSYFLWTLTQDDLSRSLFPVGGYDKSDVRRLAKEAGLPNAERKDSQGLCFLGHVDMEAFLKRYLPIKKGKVRDESGAVIGEHDGVWFYTLGQRHGFSREHEKRLYVVEKNAQKNELIVSGRERGGAGKKEYPLTGVNWISPPQQDGKMSALFRYRGPLVPVSLSGNTAVFEEPELIAPGQSLVFYDQRGERVFGGGIIA